MYANVNGVDLYFDVISSGLSVDFAGDREKPVLFVQHGGPGADHSYFRPWLDPLGEVAQVVFIDHRGTGFSSTAPLETYTIEQIADDVEALRHYLGLGRIMFLGHSFGGMVGQVYAQRHPKSLSKLILSHTAPDYGFWEEAQEIAMRIATPEQKEVFRELFEGGITNQEEYEAWWKRCYPLYFRNPDQEVLDQLSARSRGKFEVSQYMMANEIPKYDALAGLAQIDVPTLVLSSTYDWVTPPSQGERIAAAISNAKFVLFEESGHEPFAREEQQAYLDVVSDFIRA
ncbi:alpha/beta fold hydrolase [Microbacterium sp. CPCC 204701]|uniref:alpha/beta fold hydrolase n=1 Tax=Microbacterium sp. CPCC 204701 TaxID=2493084 RepID=UPI000FD85FC4|nr:alpha/beta fold hydrolase [Microbacterium sp. CPCC 204701]